MRIQTLVEDIYEVVRNNGWYSEEISRGFVRELDSRLVENLNGQPTVPSLRLSQMGKKCPSQLWHSIHSAAHAERIPPWVRIKFDYGHILESYVLELIKAAGHEVTGEQDELILDGIKGHRDCVVDGCIVDIKSLNSRSFQTLKDGMVLQDIFLRDYLDQLDGYVVASANDPLVRVKDKGYILAIDKTLGHLYLYEHHAREESIRQRIRSYRDIISIPRPPRCTCEEIPDGKSGNIKLGVKASYNAYKYCCKPQLRTFLYASGPTYLTKVVRRPGVTEIDKYGKIIYNG